MSESTKLHGTRSRPTPFGMSFSPRTRPTLSSTSTVFPRRDAGRTIVAMDENRVGTGELLHDEVVPARGGGAWLVEMGQRIRITDIEGAAIGDFVCFNAHNLDERLSQARTK